MTPKELIRILESNGFVLKRIRGSHHVFTNKTSGKITVVPVHKGDLPRGTLHAILKQAGLDQNDLNR